MNEENKVVEAEVVEQKGIMSKIKDKLPRKGASEETEPAKKGSLKKWLKRAGMFAIGAAIGGAGYVLGQRSKAKDDAIDCDYTETEYDSEEE